MFRNKHTHTHTQQQQQQQQLMKKDYEFEKNQGEKYGKFWKEELGEILRFYYNLKNNLKIS